MYYEGIQVMENKIERIGFKKIQSEDDIYCAAGF